MKSSILALLLVLLLSCKGEDKTALIDDTYKAEVETYRGETHENRKNYLQLTGLFPLKQGENSFGRLASNSLVLDIESLPATVGTFTLSDTSFEFLPADSVIVKTKDNAPVTRVGSDLNTITELPRLYHNRINWQVILRSGKYYLRVWDTENPMVDAFKGFEHYELNPDFIFDGQFTYFENEKTEEVTSQLGVNASTKFIGSVSFEIRGKTHQLDVGQSGFTMVYDETSSDDTYGGGRYVYLDLPESNGSVRVDFNRLYNPPCSFSKFTTCLYPPLQNHLPFKITAGEKIQRQ